jgi:hypothetical protein
MQKDLVSLVDLARIVEICEEIAATFRAAGISDALRDLYVELYSRLDTYQAFTNPHGQVDMVEPVC